MNNRILFLCFLFFIEVLNNTCGEGCNPGECCWHYEDTANPYGHTCRNCYDGFYCPGSGFSWDCTSSDHPYYGNGAKGNYPCATGVYKCEIQGYHCTGNAISETEKPCPIGFYCPDPSSKIECTGGKYCPDTKMTSIPSTNICKEGYYCSGGAVDEYGDGLCQIGYLCPAGSSSATQEICPAGSYCPDTITKVDCPAGSYCIEGSGGITGSCSAGFYCPSKSSSSKQIVCPAGSYCASGSSSPTLCSAGGYCPQESNFEGNCGKGNYCPSTTQRISCKKGNYCPSSRETEQTICPAGKYCATDGLSSFTGNCKKGYYCPEGSTSATEYQCLNTQFCPEGSTMAIDCNCNGMGSCETSKNDCNCFEGSIGDNCEIFSCYGIPKSNESSCSLNGYCKTMDECACNDGYFGKQCESWVCYNIPKNESNVCSGNGFCQKYDTCECNEGFFGNDCSSSVVGNIALPIIGAVTGGVFLFIICILIITIPIIICVIKQKSKLKEFDKYEDEINLIKLDEKETENNIAKFKLSKKFLTIESDEIQLIKRLGAGSFAETFLCEFSHANACFKSFKLSDFTEDNNSDFEKELELLSSISHPNIVSFIGCCLKPPKLGIVLEYCPNGDLSESIDRMLLGKIPKITFNEKLEWLMQISGAMSYLHKRGILHRDLKLENILLDKLNNCKLCDFGLSRAIEENGKAKTMTKRVGTSIYIAPEVTIGQKYSTSCDVFSFAIIMFQLLTLKVHPYDKKNEFGIEFQVAKKKLRPAINENDPQFKEKKWFIDLMKQSWSQDPFARPTMDKLRNTFKKHKTDNTKGGKKNIIQESTVQSKRELAMEKELLEMRKKMKELENIIEKQNQMILKFKVQSKKIPPIPKKIQQKRKSLQKRKPPKLPEKKPPLRSKPTSIAKQAPKIPSKKPVPHNFKESKPKNPPKIPSKRKRN